MFSFSIRAECWVHNGYVEIGASRLRLRLYRTGEWKLDSIAKGTVPAFKADAWHDLSYRIEGENHLICEINGQQIYAGPIARARVFPAIGSSYDPNMFRSVTIDYEKKQKFK